MPVHHKTAEHQIWAHGRIRELLAISHPPRFVSVEPMLGEIDLPLVLRKCPRECGGEYFGPDARTARDCAAAASGNRPFPASAMAIASIAREDCHLDSSQAFRAYVIAFSGSWALSDVEEAASEAR